MIAWKLSDNLQTTTVWGTCTVVCKIVHKGYFLRFWRNHQSVSLHQLTPVIRPSFNYITWLSWTEGRLQESIVWRYPLIGNNICFIHSKILLEVTYITSTIPSSEATRSEHSIFSFCYPFIKCQDILHPKIIGRSGRIPGHLFFRIFSWHDWMISFWAGLSIILLPIPQFSLAILNFLNFIGKFKGHQD